MDKVTLTAVYATQAEAQSAYFGLTVNAAGRIPLEGGPSITALSKSAGERSAFKNDLQKHTGSYPIWKLTAEFKSRKIYRADIIDRSTLTPITVAFNDSTAGIILRALGAPLAQRLDGPGALLGDSGSNGDIDAGPSVGASQSQA